MPFGCRVNIRGSLKPSCLAIQNCMSCVQGLLQAWNFNQPEALRAFKMAAEADPNAAMPYFGQAYALGPGANR